jgi:hypothetical protein
VESRDLSGGINVYAGGVTCVDPNYDERGDGEHDVERQEEAKRSPVYCEAQDFFSDMPKSGRFALALTAQRKASRQRLCVDL